MCTELMMRLCSLSELASGVCCGGGCAFDDARVWSKDDCTLPSEQTPIEALPYLPELLRVSINGQQFSLPSPHFPDHPALPSPLSGVASAVPGFTFFDSSAISLSAIVPSSGPADGGVLLTLIGIGFADLGAKVGFVAPSGEVALAPATLAVGDSRGRLLTCYSPKALASVSLPGSVRVELSLNGAPLAPAMTVGSALRYAYEGEAVGDIGSGDFGSGSGE